MTLRVLDLFSGIGGISLGLQWAGGFETVGFCEIEPFPRRVLAKHWPGVWIHDDIRTLTAGLVDEYCGHVDIVTGGFPCQPFSCAGKQKGEKDDRFLWPELARIIGEVGPCWLLLENVPNLRTIAADRVLSELEELGYTCWPLVVGADDVGAPHKRKRVWIVGHAEGIDSRTRLCRVDAAWRRGNQPTDTSGYSELADTSGTRLEGQRNGTVGTCAQHAVSASGGGEVGELADAECSGWRQECQQSRCACSSSPESEQRRDGTQDLHAYRVGYQWLARPGEQQHDWEAPRLVESALGSPAYGVSRGVARLRRDQLKALGNSVVPQVVCAIGRAIMAVEESR